MEPAAHALAAIQPRTRPRSAPYIHQGREKSLCPHLELGNQPRDHVRGINSPKLQDYALISRIQDSETGHVVVVIGGLYTYGTLAAGEFLTDSGLMQAIAGQTQRAGNRTLQIVLRTTVTDETPGPPRVLAVSTE
jgi:hypothetical protein